MNRQMFNALVAQYATPEVSGDGLVSWDGGKKCVIPSVKLYGAAVQDGEPTPENPVMPVCNNGVFAARGRNLFNLAGRAQRPLSGYASTTPREFDGNSYYVGLDANNHYIPGSIADYSIEADVGAVMVQTSATGCGVAFDFPTAFGETYTVSAVSDQIIGVSWYDADGYLISNSSAVSPQIVTAPANARWMVVVFRPAAGAAYVYSDVQLEIGDTATPYHPYYDGGQAQAPELWAILGTEYRDEWNPQTGRGIRRCGIIDSYAGEAINTPYLSSTGALTEGATVIYDIPDAPFTTSPAKLTMPTGYGQIIQVSGDVPDCPITAKYLTHS